MNHKTPSFLRKPLWWSSLLVLAMLVLAACSPAASVAPAAPTAAPTTAPAAANTMAPTMAATTAPTTASGTSGSEAEVSVATDPKLGKILVDAKGMTLYAFTKDVADKSNCSGGCLKAWPPLASQGSPKAGTGVNQSLLGTTTLADGSKIVTYNHMPLYYWAKDQKPGDVTGQDVGHVWYVVSPEGQMVKTGGVVPATGGSGSSTPAATATAGASSSSGSSSSSGASAGTSGQAVLNIVTVPNVGKYLVDGRGMTLYMFKKDTADTSNCTGGCLKAWPPFTTTGNVTAGDGVDQSLIGTASLADGSKIVTYNHMPLYFFAKDQKPGDITGQGVGGVWFLVGPHGNVMEGSAPASSGAAASSGGSAPAAGSVMVNVATDPKLGKILVDGKGMTLYIFTKDTADKSNCTGGCLKAWPPFTATSSATAGMGVDQSMLGTATLADGSKIVTYNHMPLYFWASDTKPGDTTGQGVGGVWFVISPDGKPVMTSGQ